MKLRSFVSSHAPPRPLFLLLPAAIVVTSFGVVPVANLVPLSLVGPEQQLGQSGFARFLSDAFYLSVLADTLRVALIAAGVALVLAYPAALFLYLSSSRSVRTAIVLLALSPLFISVAVRSYAWLVILGPAGPLGDLRLLYTDVAVMIGLVHVLFPFVLLSIAASLSSVDRTYLAAARTLGSGSLRVLLDVLLPLSMPGVLSGAIIAFSIGMTSFVIQVLLGGTSFKTVVYLIYQQVLVLGDWPFGAAITVILLVVTSALIAMALRTNRATVTVVT